MQDKGNAFLDQRSNNPRFSVKEQMVAFKESGGVAETYDRVKGGPHQEWVRAIKGDGPECGSNFDYAAPMREVACSACSRSALVVVSSGTQKHAHHQSS